MAEIRRLVAESSALAAEEIEVCDSLTIQDWAAAKVDSKVIDPASAVFRKEKGTWRLFVIGALLEPDWMHSKKVPPVIRQFLGY